MSGLIGKKNSTLKKESVKENKLLTVGVKAIKFWHEALADGETSIPFGTLNMPADVAIHGFSNPTGTELLAANLALFHTNVEVHSSLNQKLMEGLAYVVKNNQINFINSYESLEGEIFTIVYKNDTITGNNVVDARPLTATGVLSIGQTDFNVGEAFKTNNYPNDQIGEVLVFVDGVLQFRNVGNATAAPAADGNYEEVHSTSGFGVIIRFNDVFVAEKNIVVVSRNLIAERPDISMLQLIESVSGQLDAMIPTLAVIAGVPEANFQAMANSVDLKAFNDKVTAFRGDIDTNKINAGVIGDVKTSMLSEAQFQALRDSSWILMDGRSVVGSGYETITGNTNIPDARGLVLRGKNNGRSDGKENPDGDVALGTFQDHEIVSHSHQKILAPQPAGAGNGTPQSSAGSETLRPTSNNATGGNETRMRNTTVNFFIKINA